MKLVSRTVFTILLALWTMAGALAAAAGYRLEVAGLACPFCAYGIEKKLNALDGVDRVDTSIKDGVVTVIMKEGATLDAPTVRRAVEDAGFTLDGFEQLSRDGDQ